MLSFNEHVALETGIRFPNAKDRSGETVYATTLRDGRQIWINGASVQRYIRNAIVSMHGTCRLVDGTLSPIIIDTDAKGGDITVTSLLASQARPADVSKEEWDKKLALGALEGIPNPIIDSVEELIKEFLVSIKPIVDFREKTEKRLSNTLTSFRAPESRE